MPSLVSRWNFKAQYWGSMLLFKMARASCEASGSRAHTGSSAFAHKEGAMLQGKFYEIFEMDAHVAADILDLTAMKARRQ